MKVKFKSFWAAVKANWIEVLLLALAATSVLLSAIAATYWPEKMLFARSGALLVLLPAIVDYRLGSLMKAEISRASIVAALGYPTPVSLTTGQQWIGRFSHTFIVVGTLIWGYGDLILN
ncbi:hypothetical protein [Chitinimonas naiadis]